MPLISHSTDLTKYRLRKVEPEPLKPLRVQSVGPEAWCPPTLQDSAAAWGEIPSPEVKKGTKLGVSIVFPRPSWGENVFLG